MNKKAILALCIAILIPVISYLYVKLASDGAVDIPPRYLPDTTITRVDGGKMITDTIWHKVADIRLQNQLGDTVNLYDIQGKAIVMDFFFTSCGSICPKLTRNMAKLQQSFLKGGDTRQKLDTSIVQFVSFTVDPKRDSVSRLKDYADRYGANHDNWWFLTGAKDSIYNFVFEQLKVDKYSSEPIDSNFVHTGKYVLVDRNFNVRGYYNGLDTNAVSKLARDIGVLMLEKEPGSKPKLPFDPALMGIFFAITILIVAIVMRILSKKRLLN